MSLIPNYSLCMQLFDAGIEGETYWKYDMRDKRLYHQCVFEIESFRGYDNVVPAPDVAQLVDLLPWTIKYNKQHLILCMKKLGGLGYTAEYRKSAKNKATLSTMGGSLADALGKMVLRMIDEGFIPLEE